MLYLAAAHADSFEDAVLANTNLGGENCHRGSALGAIMGAALGESRIPEKLITGAHARHVSVSTGACMCAECCVCCVVATGLHASKEIKAEIDGFIDAVIPPAA